MMVKLAAEVDGGERLGPSTLNNLYSTRGSHAKYLKPAPGRENLGNIKRTNLENILTETQDLAIKKKVYWTDTSSSCLPNIACFQWWNETTVFTVFY